MPLIAGSYSNQLSVGTSALENQGQFDIFLARLNNGTSTSVQAEEPRLPVEIFPNPAHDHLLIKTELKQYNILLLDVEGKVLFTGQNVKEIPLNGSYKGLYLVHISTETNWGIRKVFINSP